MKSTNRGYVICKSPMGCRRKELVALADLLADLWSIQVKANMLEPTYMGNAIFWQLVKHALTRKPVSMKTLNAEVPSAPSGIRRTARNLQTNLWVNNEEGADDRRVRQLLPTEKLERRALQFLLKSTERVNQYLSEREIHRPLSVKAPRETPNCALCRSNLI